MNQTFKQFLAESRTKVVDVETFIKWADKNASVYMNGPHFLYRGGSGDGGKGLRIGTSVDGKPRKSANTYNNYTLWFDNHPMFKDWPKRSQAWIGSDDRDIAENFGSPALLIVDDEAKVGLTGEVDLWHTPLGLDWGSHAMTIEDFNELSESLMTGDHDDIGSLTSALKAVDIEDIERHLEDDNDEDGSRLRALHTFMEKRKLHNLYDVWEAVMVPSIFAENTKGAQVSGRRSDGEVWIEGEVGFIPHVNRLSEKDANRITEWADQYPELLEEIQQHWNTQDYD